MFAAKIQPLKSLNIDIGIVVLWVDGAQGANWIEGQLPASENPIWQSMLIISLSQ
jgi:hypothetical protein